MEIEDLRQVVVVTAGQEIGTALIVKI